MDILIFGSCVSRDAFNYETAGNLKLLDYYSRSSMASAFHSIPREDRYSHSLASPFQRRMVHADFSKEFRNKLPRLSFDVLLVDFIDERLPLCVHESGSIVTVSNELRKAKFLKNQDGRIIHPHTQSHFELWEKGWSEFVTQAAQQGFLNRIWIHHAYWSTENEDGSPFSSQAAEEIDAANAHLNKLYRRTALDIPKNQSLIVETELLRANRAHRWGPAPFHYVDEYHHRLTELLSSVTPRN